MASGEGADAVRLRVSGVALRWMAEAAGGAEGEGMTMRSGRIQEVKQRVWDRHRGPGRGAPLALAHVGGVW